MTRLARTLATSCGTVLALVACAACNAVLGIERATLEQDAATPPANRPPEACVPQNLSSCRCWDGCAEQKQQCLADVECQRALTQYQDCLGPDCEDDAVDSCLEVKLATNALAKSLRTCLRGCSKDCASQLATFCERDYCTCMSAFCDENFATRWQGDLPACVDECVAWGSYKAGCLMDHCVFVKTQNDAHCHHSLSYPACVGDEARTRRPDLCLAGRDHGAPCDSDDDCCQEGVELRCVNTECRRQ